MFLFFGAIDLFEGKILVKRFLMFNFCRLLFSGATMEDGELVRILFNSVGVCEMVPEYQQVLTLTIYI